MKKILFTIIAVLMTALTFTSCTTVEPEAGEEAVLIDKPVIFGDGGVRDYTIPTGRQYTWLSTDYVIFSTIPTKYSEVLNDVCSNENTPLDFNISITISVNKGEAWKLYKNYGVGWYENNIKEVYQNATRNYISRYSTFDLTSNRETLEEIDNMIKKYMTEYIAKQSKINGEMPITVVNVITGRAIPNAPQLDEMNKTAAQIQAKQTQERAFEVEVAREKAEKQRAIADKAYQTELNLSTEQFIRLKAWDVIKAKNGANIDVLFDGGSSEKMWNVRR